VKDPVKNAHARRMREDVHFYRDWLLPKFKLYCEDLGWQMPKVGAFEIGTDDLRREGMGWIDDRIENGDMQQRQHELAATQQAHSGGDEERSSASPRTHSSYLSVSTKFPFGILKNFIFHRGETKEERIAAARLRAAKRMQPESFSESKIHRLNELKAVKERAEDRIRARTLSGGSSFAEHDSVSSHCTLQTLQDLEDEEEELRYSAVAFIFSFTIHAMLLLLRYHPIFDTRITTSLIARELVDLVLVVLQATSLWAMINSVLLRAFEEVDFGQKKLLMNMTFGKKLFIREVKKFSLIVSASVAIVACGLGLASGSIFGRFCLSQDENNIIMPSLFSGWHKSPSEEDVRLRTIFSVLLYVSADNLDALESAFSTFADIFGTACRIFRTAVSWATLKLSYIVPGPPKKVLTSASAYLAEIIIPNSPTQWRVCEYRVAVGERWMSRALDISSFFTLRLGVFVLALVLMGRLLLPKPEKRAKIKADAAKFGPSSRAETNPVVSSAASSSLNESIHGGNIMSPMEVIAEEFNDGVS